MFVVVRYYSGSNDIFALKNPFFSTKELALEYIKKKLEEHIENNPRGVYQYLVLKVEEYIDYNETIRNVSGVELDYLLEKKL